MPVGKYYCDYCDKEFQDTAAARRRHLQGVAHKREKALWYDKVRTTSSYPGFNQFPDPQSIGKAGVCNHFVRTGTCQYGDSCRYYHPKQNTPDMNNQAMEAKGFVGTQSQDVTGNLFHGEASLPVMLGNQLGTSLGNLPPSLWPPPEGGYPPLPLIDWG